MEKEIGSYEVESALNTLYECILGKDNIYEGVDVESIQKEHEEMKKAFTKIAKRMYDFIEVGHFEASEIRTRHRIRKDTE